jgi:hypothetical protein
MTWLNANASHYVLCIQRTLIPPDARVHYAWCLSSTGTPPRGRTWSGQHVKACSSFLLDLDNWPLAHARSVIIGVAPEGPVGSIVHLAMKHATDPAREAHAETAGV